MGSESPSGIDSSGDRRPATSTSDVVFLFFLSGVSGLIYEVIWFKRLAVIWGNSTLATGAVTAAFMLGLSVGAWVIGQYADRTRNGLHVYGVLELLIGALAILIPFEFELVAVLAANAYDSLSAHPALSTATRIASTFVVLGPPCALMGGTLPLMSGWLARRSHSGADSVTGLLYGINTLGAAVGVYLAGFFLLPRLGLDVTNLVAIGLNVIVGIGAISLGRETSANPENSGAETTTLSAESSAPEDIEVNRLTGIDAAPTSDADRFYSSLRRAHGAAFLSGFAALILETVWIRQLLLVLGASTYAFSSILVIVLLGIAMGSLLYSLVNLRGNSERKLQSGWIAIAGIVGSAYLGQWGLPTLASIVGALGPFRDTDFGNAMICLISSGVLAFVPAVGMGILMPLIVHAGEEERALLGKRLGQIYGWNTAGCIVGATIGSAVAIPRWGTWSAFLFSIAAYFVIAQLLESRFRSPLGIFRLGVSTAGLLLLMVVGNPVPITPLNLGQYLYGPIRTIGDDKILLYKEGISANIIVTRNSSQTSLRVNGKADASTGIGDMQTQSALAYFPRIFRPHARDVLVVGFGSGTTTGTTLLFPETRVTCCELEPAVVEAAVHFSSINHRPCESPNLTLVYDDARGFLQGTQNSFDMIISEPSNPWMDGVAALYTVEHFRTSKRRLRPGGMYAQWVQTYNLEPQDYVLILRTFASVFRHSVVLTPNADIGDTIIVGCDEPLDLTAKSIADAQAQFDAIPEVGSDLTKLFQTRSVRSLLVEHYLLDDQEVAKLIRPGSGLNTDHNMRLAFDAPRRLFRRIRQPVGKAVADAIDAAQIQRRCHAWECGVEQLPALRMLCDRLDSNKNPARSQAIFEFGLSLDPENVWIQVDRQLLKIRTTGEFDSSAVTSIAAASAIEANRMGFTLWQEKKYEPAVAVFEELVRAQPGSVIAWENLATNLKALGRIEQANAAFKKACELDPCRKYD